LSTRLAYRFATTEDLHDAGRLISHSFPGPTRTAAWLHEQLSAPVWGGGAETLFVGWESARMVAACQLHPLRQWVAGRALQCAGVGTVAISPVYRRLGLGAELMGAALRAAHDRGDAVSALYPFRTSFYGRLGYGQAGEVLQYQVAPAELPDSSERRQVEVLATATGRAEALALYGRWARRQTGQLERTDRVWARLWSEQDRALVGYRAAGGELEGYALVVYRADLPRRDRFLEVDELVFTTAPARAGLLGWLASLGDQWEQVVVRALPSERLHDRLREPRLPIGAEPPWGLWAPAAVLQLGPMFRLVNMRAAWELRHVAAGRRLALALDVIDAQLPENAGRWRFTFEEGRTVVDQDGRADLTVRLDVATLSRLYVASLRPTAARDAGLLECDRPERLPDLDALLALPEPWTFDRF
jgi:predicted acetyltransferase